ncbi:hypothetical protein GOBAR_AA32481 [Gossypium barbadense]|uniref:Uncharacterized protein n=1 Tax=Gossypium barbadense TaxID=3634 RepID=A0A2P5WAU2_GOSBA|nr:hypothetical protein GOBAR_AA32481 [Gossypium barbadense]
MFKSMTYVQSYVKEIVQEFFCKVKHDVDIDGSTNFHQVKIWGNMFTFSPSIINQFLVNLGIHDECANGYNNIVNVITAINKFSINKALACLLYKVSQGIQFDIGQFLLKSFFHLSLVYQPLQLNIKLKSNVLAKESRDFKISSKLFEATQFTKRPGVGCAEN